MGRPKLVTTDRKIATKINNVVAMDKGQAVAYASMIEIAIANMELQWGVDNTKEQRRYLQTLHSKLLDAKDIINKV